MSPQVEEARHCATIRNEPEADGAALPARPKSVGLSSLTRSDLLMSFDSQNRWIHACTWGRAPELPQCVSGAPPDGAPTAFDSQYPLGGGSCRQSRPVRSEPARSSAGAGSYKGTDPIRVGPESPTDVRPDVRLETPIDRNAPATAGDLAANPAVVEHCGKIRNEPKADAAPRRAGPGRRDSSPGVVAAGAARPQPPGGQQDRDEDRADSRPAPHRAGLTLSTDLHDSSAAQRKSSSNPVKVEKLAQPVPIYAGRDLEGSGASPSGSVDAEL